MSGIAGIIRFDGAPVEPALIVRMTDAMASRGPDGHGHWVRGPVGLGHCMLRTTAESLEETQPLANEDASIVLVMDGWLANWEELRLELLARGARLRTRADAELVMRAYEAWGSDCLAHINGEFAFAIWNSRERALFCARDRMGLKPFYYHWDGKVFVFASELAAILDNPSIPEKPNSGMIAEYIAHQWHARDETLWVGVKRLVHAHQMRVTGGIEIERYWVPQLDTPISYKNEEDYLDHYRHLLTDCVRCASRSHKPTAYEVSGGLDSSAVFCLAAHLVGERRLPAPAIQAYSFDFARDRSANEVAYARAVGDHIGASVRQVAPFIPSPQWLQDYTKAHRDFPGFPNALLSVGLYGAISARGHRVSVGGDGGDEWLTGTRLYYADHLTHGSWADLRDALAVDVEVAGLRRTASWFLRHGVARALPFDVLSAFRTAKQKLIGNQRDGPDSLSWMSRQARLLARQRHSYDGCKRSGTGSAVHQYQLDLLDSPYFANAFDHAERISAISGVERRSPMRDYRFVQFAFSTPENMRLRGFTTKYIHRKALQGVLPQSVLDRVDKAEFSVAFLESLCHIEQELIGPIAETWRPWLQPGGVARLCDTLLRDRAHLWPMWVLWGIYGCHLAIAQSKSVSRGAQKKFRELQE